MRKNVARQKKKGRARNESAKAQTERTQKNAQNGALFSNRQSILFPVYAAVMLLIVVITVYLMYQSAQTAGTGAPLTKTAAQDAQQRQAD
jgi:cell division protein FtsL